MAGHQHRPDQLPADAVGERHGIKGIAGLTFSGSIQGIQIDIGKLLAGEFPIVGIASIGVEVKGDLFGGEIDAELIGGIQKLDASGNMIADTDTTTPVASARVLRRPPGSFTMAGSAASRSSWRCRARPAFGFLSVSLPTGITLDPDTGLTINNFAGGVQFFHRCRRSTTRCSSGTRASRTRRAVTPDTWLATVKQQVVNQYKASLANPGQNGWAAAFTRR